MSAREIKAGAAFIDVSLRSKKLHDQLNRISRRVKGFGVTVGKVGGAVAGAGAAILTPLIAAGKQFASTGDDLHKMSMRTGVSVESLSQLKYAADQSGTSIDSVAGTIQKMNRRMGRLTAGQGSKSQIKALEELGLSIEELEQMGPEQRFMAMADAISGYGDQAAAAGLAQRAMGAGVDKLLPLFAQGAEGIEKMKDQAHELGLTLSQEDADAAAALTDALSRVKFTLKGLVLQIGADVAPTLTFMAETFASTTKSLVHWVKENKGVVMAAGATGVALVALGGIITTLGMGIVGVGAIISGLASIIGFLASPVGIAAAAIGGLVIISGAAVAAFLQLTDAGQVAKAGIADAFGRASTNILKTFGTAVEGIRDSIIAADLEGALDIAFAAGVAAIARGGQAIMEASAKLNRAVADSLPMIAFAYKKMFGMIADGAEEAAAKMEEAAVVQEAKVGNMTADAAEKRKEREEEKKREEERKKARSESLQQAIEANKERLKGLDEESEKAKDVQKWIETLQDELADVDPMAAMMMGVSVPGMPDMPDAGDAGDMPEQLTEDERREQQIEQENAAIERQIMALKGLNEEAKRQELEDRGFSAEQIEERIALLQKQEAVQKAANEADAAEQKRKTYQQQNDQLRYQITLLKEGRIAAERQRMEAEGFSDDQIAKRMDLLRAEEVAREEAEERRKIDSDMDKSKSIAGKVAGTFSAAAAVQMGIGGTSAAERTAKNTERMNKLLASIERKVDPRNQKRAKAAVRAQFT